jgi:hypothetical protein
MSWDGTAWFACADLVSESVGIVVPCRTPRWLACTVYPNSGLHATLHGTRDDADMALAQDWGNRPVTWFGAVEMDPPVLDFARLARTGLWSDEEQAWARRAAYLVVRAAAADVWRHSPRIGAAV